MSSCGDRFPGWCVLLADRWWIKSEFLAEQIELVTFHVADRDPAPSLRTADQGGEHPGASLRNSNSRRQVSCQVVKAAEFPWDLRIDDLRVCLPSLLVAGADPKAVQLHPGHSSITVAMGLIRRGRSRS